MIKNRVNDIIANNKGIFKMPKELYNNVLKDMNPNEILSLFGHAHQFNSYYNSLRGTYLEIAYIDLEYIFEKILKTKNVDFINIALSFEPKFQDRAYKFLKECNDVKFTYEFIYAVDFDWNPYFEYLKRIKILDLNVLWNKVVQKNELNIKNMAEFLSDDRFNVLRVMYFINIGVKFNVLETNVVNTQLGLSCSTNEIKKVNQEFYAKKIICLEKLYFKSIIYDNPQISFNDLNINEQPSDGEPDTCKVFKNN